MIRKRYLAAAGLLTLAVVAAGCGKKNDAGSVVQATPTPTEETSVSPTPTPEMVNMEETVEKNIMGEKTSTASKVTIVNRTGSEIAAIYIRETPSDDADEDTADEWGDDLVNGMFTLKTMQFIIMRNHSQRQPYMISELRTQMKKKMNVSSENCRLQRLNRSHFVWMEKMKMRFRMQPI